LIRQKREMPRCARNDKTLDTGTKRKEALRRGMPLC
jgi:hypothetical protein